MPMPEQFTQKLSPKIYSGPYRSYCCHVRTKIATRGTMGTTGRSTVSILPLLQAPQGKTDMEYVKEFIAEWKKNHPRVSWKECYRQGVSKGFFKSYTDSSSLKSTYYEMLRVKK
ncbi:hypothetical protein BJV82DRAFT_398664 [Fennellomyces sp. T-0311]|nr:hypothetical protein BJV82DRAFT_398664 [Fennellomyces sp. T-0311]